MSGIAAALFRNRRPEQVALQRMLAGAPHRGAITETATLGNAVIGVVRDGEINDAGLAVNGKLAVAFSGTIDNRDALRAEIQRAGISIAGTKDAETLLAAFGFFGQGLPAQLRGVFAAAITDGKNLWCFRDHLGQRSLFYGTTEAAVFVASEAKQVAAGALIPMRAEREAAERVFWGNCGTASALRGIERLLAATLLEVSSRTLSLRRYWNPAELLETARLPAEELQEHFDLLMTQAVRRCMTGRDAVWLSGGIDSPTIAAYAAPLYRQLYGRPLPALSIVAPRHLSVDESEYIRTVIDRFDLPWHTYEQRVLTGGDLSRWAELCDGPISVISMNEIEESFAVARNLGFQSSLSGEWAEFLMDRPEGLLVHLLIHGRARALAEHIRIEHSRGRSPFVIGRELASVLAPRWWTVQRRRRAHQCPPWLNRRLATTGVALYTSASRRRWRDGQLAAFVGTSSTVEAHEVCQMLYGVRVRRPWADVDLWEFFLSLPAEVKYPGPLRKSIVRNLARGRVPDVILDRRTKTVFNESAEARLDYEELARWLARPNITISGVDYATLKERIAARNLKIGEFMWARDLASVHAFLERYGE